MGFPRQESWSGLAFLFLVDISNPGIELTSPALQVDSLLTEWGDYLKFMGIMLFFWRIQSTFVLIPLIVLWKSKQDKPK